jgi:hypothetical protein
VHGAKVSLNVIGSSKNIAFFDDVGVVKTSLDFFCEALA